MHEINYNRLDNLIALPYGNQIQWVAVGHTHLHIHDKTEAQIYGMLTACQKGWQLFHPQIRSILQWAQGTKKQGSSQ